MMHLWQDSMMKNCSWKEKMLRTWYSDVNKASYPPVDDAQTFSKLFGSRNPWIHAQIVGLRCLEYHMFLIKFKVHTVLLDHCLDSGNLGNATARSIWVKLQNQQVQPWQFAPHEQTSCFLIRVHCCCIWASLWFVCIVSGVLCLRVYHDACSHKRNVNPCY